VEELLSGGVWPVKTGVRFLQAYREARGGPRVGQLKISGVLSSEPAGKPLRELARGECLVTYDAGEEDEEVRRRHGLTGLRRARLLRIATEAHVRGVDLTQGDLAKILGSGLKTIKRDIAYFRRQGVYLPTRGQQKDLGPIAPHQVEAVRLILEGRSESEVSGRILHSPGMLARMLGTFARVVSLLRAGWRPEEVARRMGVPRRLVAEYGGLAAEADGDPARRERLEVMVRSSQGDGQEDVVRARPRRRPPIFDEQVRVLRRDVFDYVLDQELRKATRYRLPLSLVVIEPTRLEGPTPRGLTLASKTLAELLRGQLRATDIVGRAALARYLVLLPLADAATTRGALDRLGQAPGEKFVAGAACFPSHGSRARQLLRESERALASAREQGRTYVLPSEAAASSGTPSSTA
jgi:hypothetical protein